MKFDPKNLCQLIEGDSQNSIPQRSICFQVIKHHSINVKFVANFAIDLHNC